VRSFIAAVFERVERGVGLGDLRGVRPMGQGADRPAIMCAHPVHVPLQLARAEGNPRVGPRRDELGGGPRPRLSEHGAQRGFDLVASGELWSGSRPSTVQGGAPVGAKAGEEATDRRDAGAPMLGDLGWRPAGVREAEHLTPVALVGRQGTVATPCLDGVALVGYQGYSNQPESLHHP